MAIRFNPRGGRQETLAHLNWRVRLFSVGAGLALGGIFLDLPALIWAAMAFLGVGLVLRFFSVTGEDGLEPGGEEDSSEEDRERSMGDPESEAPHELPEDPRGPGADAPAP